MLHRQLPERFTSTSRSSFAEGRLTMLQMRYKLPQCDGPPGIDRSWLQASKLLERLENAMCLLVVKAKNKAICTMWFGARLQTPLGNSNGVSAARRLTTSLFHLQVDARA